MPPSTNGSAAHPPRIAVLPHDAPAWAAEAVAAGGGHVVPLEEAEALLWAAMPDPGHLREILDRHGDELRWVQLPFAGVEDYLSVIDDGRQWTCGKGVYAEPVAEMALALALAGLRGLASYARATSWQGPPRGTSLMGANVTILGGGGITESLIKLLGPFDCHITVVRNRVQDMDGVDDVLEADRYVDALPGADVVVLALALTPDTEGIIGRGELEMMESHAWLVNVARGRHVVTDDLVWALREGVIGGAALDVTDPEPLPDGHPLWSMPNAIITPHSGNTKEMAAPLLSERITANVRRFAVGDDLIGPIDLESGY